MQITITPAPLTTEINGQTFEVKKTGNRYFYFSRINARWMPVAKANVKFIMMPIIPAKPVNSSWDGKMPQSSNSLSNYREEDSYADA